MNTTTTPWDMISDRDQRQAIREARANCDHHACPHVAQWERRVNGFRVQVCDLHLPAEAQS